MPTHRSTTDLTRTPSFGTILGSYSVPVERRLQVERVILALLRAAVSAYSLSNPGVQSARSSSKPGVRHSGTGGTY